MAERPQVYVLNANRTQDVKKEDPRDPCKGGYRVDCTLVMKNGGCARAWPGNARRSLLQWLSPARFPPRSHARNATSRILGSARRGTGGGIVIKKLDRG